MYNIKTHEWTKMADFTHERGGCQTTVVRTQKRGQDEFYIYLAIGDDPEIRSIERYNVRKNRWKVIQYKNDDKVS